jgi:hypothetical protein
MDAIRLLLIAGTVLLAVAALLGFVQERYRDQPALFAGWRVVHAGGTAGAVQLLALAAVWEQLAGAGLTSVLLACTLISVTWAFFLGPLARVLGWLRIARLLNTVGAILAGPGYLALLVVLAV